MNPKDEITYYVEFVLPSLAIKYKWPIRFDHCFRRVIYDTLCQSKWDDHIPAPAIHNMTHTQLIDCLTICKSIIHKPDCLPELNTLSLGYRK
jgi:hypothetical protein